MTKNCPQPEALLAALAEGPEHPWREHTDSCPRCQALIKAHDSFLADDLAGEHPRSDEAAASARLQSSVTDLPRRRTRRANPTWLLGLAAVLLVGLGLFTLAPRTGTFSSRDDLDTGITGEVRLRGDDLAWPAPTVAVKDGSLIVGWDLTPAADRYAVVLLTADLTEVARLDAGPLTELTASREMAAPAAGGFVVIIALRDNQELGRTMPSGLPW